MRYAMDYRKEDADGVSVMREIDQIKKLIKIYQLGYGDRLFVSFNQEGNLANVKIIPLVLITLLENALKHGDLGNPLHPVTIQVNAQEDFFTYSIFNRKRDGPKEISHGIGLPNLIKRLEQRYKDNFTLDIKNEEFTYEAFLRIKLY